MRVLIFGAGAMSCLFGARLAPVADVTLIDTWKEGIDAIRESGILLEDANGRRTVSVHAENLGTSLEPFDLAFVLVKSWQTGFISKYLPGYLKPEGIAISLQNGLGNVEQLGAKAFPGTTAEGATLLGPGQVKAGGSGPTHIVAPAWVVDLLKSAGFEAYACDADKAGSLLWGKLSVSCGINALTALLRIPNGELLKRPAATDLMGRAVLECVAVARAAGIDPAVCRCRCLTQRKLPNGRQPTNLRCSRIFCGARRPNAMRLTAPSCAKEHVWALRRRSTKFFGSL